MPVRLFLFGSPAVEHEGGSFALPFERRSQLLVFLALKRAWVGRAELAALLWPEQTSKLAYSNLRKTLFRLQSLPWSPHIDSQGSALRFEAETDVHAFESALRESRGPQALALRRGELLAGLEDDANDAWSSWLNFERDRLRVAWRGAALERLALDIDAAEGIELSARLLDADPLDEAALHAHMSWLARDGQGGRARQVYRDFVDRLARDLGLEPGTELKALHDSIAPAAVAGPPQARLPTRPAPPADGFIGRAVELRRIADLLVRDTCRLLGIVGPGGVGKTRLARAAMQQLAAEFADGAVFVPLEDLASISELGGRLAREVGHGLVGKVEPLDQVIDYLRGRQMLLVLDNFEHLADQAAILERLLEQCGRLRIIVTSRVRLAVPSEWVLPLEGLPCPENDDRDHVEAFDAVRLFVQAAHRVEPGLSVAAEATAIIDICRQVEGLPLALELAAAWTRVLPCEAIAAELHQGIDLLNTVSATHPPRHASIETVFDQSWRLLSVVERETLARLSVFRGGFTAQAARAVAGAPLPVLGALADKSLLRKERSRLYLHPLVQQLAGARLDAGSTAAATQAAHASYFHRYLVQLRPAVAAGERSALQWVDDEFENCRRAWSTSIARGGADALVRSAATLLDYCDYRGRFEDGLALFLQSIDSPLGRADRSLQTMMLSRAAHLQYRLDRYDEAEVGARRALAATGRRGANETRRQAVIVLATCAFRRGRLAEARRYFKQTLKFASADTQAHALAVAYDHLALIEKTMGQYAEALRLSLQSLAEHRRLGDSAGEALCLNNLGSLYLATNENEAAGMRLREGLAICERDGLVSTRGFILANLAEVAFRAGDLDTAEAFTGRALDTAQTAGHRAVVAWLKIMHARVALRQGDLTAARTRLADGLGLATTLGAPTLKFVAVLCFAELLEAQGELSNAHRVLAFAADHSTATPTVRDQIRSRMAQLPAAPGPQAGWPGIELDELVHRIVVEASLAHAPLIAALRPAS